MSSKRDSERAPATEEHARVPLRFRRIILPSARSPSLQADGATVSASFVTARSHACLASPSPGHQGKRTALAYTQRLERPVPPCIRIAGRPERTARARILGAALQRIRRAFSPADVSRTRGFHSHGISPVSTSGALAHPAEQEGSVRVSMLRVMYLVYLLPISFFSGNICQSPTQR